MNFKAGGGAYFFAKRSINADKQARHEADLKRRQLSKLPEPSIGKPNAKKKSRRSNEISNDSAQNTQSPDKEGSTAEDRSKYEAALCKEWLLTKTASSVAKIGAVGKYLVALSASFRIFDSTAGSHARGREGALNRRRQLSVLYLLHDLLHHTKFHPTDPVDNTLFDRALEPAIIQLVGQASAYGAAVRPRHIDKVNSLLKVWAEREYFPTSFVGILQDTLANASNSEYPHDDAIKVKEESTNAVELRTGAVRKDAPYIMPLSHGDASLPYYDLPAGNLMPCIVPNSSLPIKPQTVKPVQLRAGPADESLVRAVRAFLQETDTIYGAKSMTSGAEVADINELGQPTVVKDISGELPAAMQPYLTLGMKEVLRGEEVAPLQPAEATQDLLHFPDQSLVEGKRDASDDSPMASIPGLAVARSRETLRRVEILEGGSELLQGSPNQDQDHTHHLK
ncbi:MAG: hypothetical protein Q9220_004079 [cf. Caloplaca sp. 1 TL-2023]